MNFTTLTQIEICRRWSGNNPALYRPKVDSRAYRGRRQNIGRHLCPVHRNATVSPSAAPVSGRQSRGEIGTGERELGYVALRLPAGMRLSGPIRLGLETDDDLRGCLVLAVRRADTKRDNITGVEIDRHAYQCGVLNLGLHHSTCPRNCPQNATLPATESSWSEFA